MPRFIGRVDVHQWRRWWVLDKPLRFVGEIGVEVPAEFITDLCSIPFGLRNLLSPTDPRWSAPALVHDYCYEVGAFKRKVCDRLFLEAMSVDPQPTGVPAASRALRWTLYAGVRVGGWRAYRTGRKRGEARLRAYRDFAQCA